METTLIFQLTARMESASRRQVQKAVEFAHRQLGHPSRDTLVRMLRMSGANADAIRYARKWVCDVCACRQPPKHPMATSPVQRPFGFNRAVHVDLKYVYDSRGRRYVALSVVDLGTVYHICCLLKTRRSDYVAAKFFRHWIQPFGAPERIWHDQGGEFELSFVQLLEQMAIPSTVTGAHAGWQLGVGERHGGILGNMLSAITMEHQTEGFTAMKAALAAAISAKNMTITKDGFSPNQRLFGTEVRYPSLTEEDARPSFAEGLDAETEWSRSHRMRVTGRIALIRLDVQNKLKRAILRKPPGAYDGVYVPGTQIYFWNPKRAHRRYERGGAWRGPATILCREGQRRYFASWRGRALLLAQENIRLATKEEMALNEPAKMDAEEVGHLLRDPLRENQYRDQSHMARPPQKKRRAAVPEDDPDRKKARLMMRGTKAIRNLLRERLEQFWKTRKKRMLPPPDQAQAAPARRKMKAVAAPEPEGGREASVPAVPAILDEPVEPLGGSDSEVYQPTSREGTEPPQSGHASDADSEPDMQSRVAEPSRTDMPRVAPKVRPRMARAPEERALGATPGLRLPQDSVNIPVPDTPRRAEDVPVPEVNDEDWLQEIARRQRLSPEERRRLSEDDVPMSIKSEGGEYL